MAWAVKEVGKRREKLEAFAKERGGGSLVQLIWHGTNVDTRKRGWLAFRRSGKHPEILDRAIYFVEESPNGRNYWLSVPKLTPSELEDISSLWSDVTERYAEKLGAVYLHKGTLHADVEVTLVSINPNGIFTVGETAVHLYLLARKSVFLLVLEGRPSPSDGFRRFAQALGKNAALFGEDMKNTDEEDEMADQNEQDEDSEDGDDDVQDKEKMPPIKSIPCPEHQGAHPCVPDGVTDFNIIERFMKSRWGYELADGTFVIRHWHVSYCSEDAIPAYHPLPPLEYI